VAAAEHEGRAVGDEARIHHPDRRRVEQVAREALVADRHHQEQHGERHQLAGRVGEAIDLADRGVEARGEVVLHEAADSIRDYCRPAFGPRWVTAPRFAGPTSATYFSSTPVTSRRGGRGFLFFREVFASSTPLTASMRIGSPSRSSASGPPAAASGET